MLSQLGSKWSVVFSDYLLDAAGNRERVGLRFERIGDVDNDADLVCPLAGSSRILVVSRSNGTGVPLTGSGNNPGGGPFQLIFSVWSQTTNTDYATVYVTAITGDGRDDILLSGKVNGTSGLANLWLLESSGTEFNNYTEYAMSAAQQTLCRDPTRCVIQDLTGDGIADLVQVDSSGNVFEAWGL